MIRSIILAVGVVILSASFETGTLQEWSGSTPNTAPRIEIVYPQDGGVY